jgi:hypothetical protein
MFAMLLLVLFQTCSCVLVEGSSSRNLWAQVAAAAAAGATMQLLWRCCQTQ